MHWSRKEANGTASDSRSNQLAGCEFEFLRVDASSGRKLRLVAGALGQPAARLDFTTRRSYTLNFCCWINIHSNCVILCNARPARPKTAPPRKIATPAVNGSNGAV